MDFLRKCCQNNGTINVHTGRKTSNVVWWWNVSLFMSYFTEFVKNK